MCFALHSKHANVAPILSFRFFIFVFEPQTAQSNSVTIGLKNAAGELHLLRFDARRFLYFSEQRVASISERFELKQRPDRLRGMPGCQDLLGNCVRDACSFS